VGHVLYPAQVALKYADRLSFPLHESDDREWSLEEVDARFSLDLGPRERAVLRLCPAAAGDQGCFDALVSFCFNEGSGVLQRSTLRSRYNRGDVTGAAEQFPRYRYASGRVLQGLVRRRLEEQALFLS
jgi:lysozyme